MNNSMLKGNSNRIPFMYKFIAVLLALVFWQVLSSIVKQDILIVGPVDVLCRLTTIWMEEGFWNSIWFTFGHIALGFWLGAVLGVILGFLADRFVAVEALLWPYMITIRSIPVASIVVVCLIWLSASNLSVFISFLIVLPIVYNNVCAGLRNRNKELEEISDVYGMSGLEKVRSVLLPQLAPYLLSACSVTAGMAWKAGVAAEVIGTPNGSLGQQLYLSKIYLDTDDLLAWTVIIVLISTVTEKLFLRILKKTLGKWCGAEEQYRV